MNTVYYEQVTIPMGTVHFTFRYISNLYRDHYKCIMISNIASLQNSPLVNV